jgi:hypothetical protein
LPPRQRPTEQVGLYDPRYEHDACGVAFVARLSGEPSHETVQRAITALENLEHRGAAPLRNAAVRGGIVQPEEMIARIEPKLPPSAGCPPDPGAEHECKGSADSEVAGIRVPTEVMSWQAASEPGRSWPSYQFRCLDQSGWKGIRCTTGRHASRFWARVRPLSPRHDLTLTTSIHGRPLKSELEL